MAQPPSRRVNLPPKEVPCKFFRSGVCRRGNSCWFRHEDCKRVSGYSPRGSESEISLATKSADELFDSSETKDVTSHGENSSAVFTTTASVASYGPHGQALEDNEDVDRCAICLEVPTVFGLLLNCDHVFCLSCMREWRITSGMATRVLLGTGGHNVAQDINSARRDVNGTLAANSLRAERRRREVRLNKCCPLCRSPSDFIVPSSHIPAKSTVKGHQKSGEQTEQLTKQEIVAAYLATLKRIPCKYFAATRSCQFGNDCHYAHRVPTPIITTPTASGRSPTTAESTRRQGTAADPYREYVFTSQELLQCARRFRRHRQLEYSLIDRDDVEQTADELLFYDALDPYDVIPTMFNVNPVDTTEHDLVLTISEHISRLHAHLFESR
ncbi:hypothetical protein V1525DRAFT_399842 [Lipomyces kononenkoae]|uniref:Uncharacterized protein n=1 Tax=Lipomyces kononenkoae TaxID=34357 RepID=A0ACC3T4P0_LIPKO